MAMTNNQNPRYWVDGTMPDGRLHGFPGARAPFAVFDNVNGYWLVTGLPFRWLADLILSLCIWHHGNAGASW
jgi:hypothetical protein